jgi:hypothetical protein
METSPEGFKGMHSESWNQASKNFDEKGVLGVTAQDHEALGSTPDEMLVANPGKTAAEIMTDEEILSWLNEGKQFIKENENNENMKGYIDDYKKEIPKTIKYLKSINRFPESFKE